MKRAEISRWFRLRMIPLVLLSSLAFAVATPLAYWIQKRRELTTVASVDAGRVAQIIRDAALQRPRLWRYDAQKLAERIAAEGLGQASIIVVHDDRGAAVPIHSREAPEDPGELLWGREHVMLGELKVASVWVGVTKAPLLVGTAKLAGVSALFAVLLGTALYLFPMGIVTKAEQRVKELIAQLAQTLPENERQRIARDLHDGVGQLLTAARLHLLSMKKSVGENEAMDGVARHLDDALREVRRSSSALTPLPLEELGLVRAIERLCETVASASELNVLCRVSPSLSSLLPAVEVVCYRIVQEALNNIVRHAKARNAWVRLSSSPAALELSIEDDGEGFDPEASVGVGTVSMRERVALVDGTIHLAERDGGGVRIVVTIPSPGGAS